MISRKKLLDEQALPAWGEALRAERRKLVMTNGCFDILHVGHTTYLEAARALGDALLVAVNSDDSVRKIKGTHRPLNSEQDRASVLAALACVDAVVIFGETDATRLISGVRPDIYVKGGDYTVETINQDERRLVERLGGKVIVLPGVPGKSTTALLEKISRL